MRNPGLDEAQARIEIAGRNINNLRYADDTTLMGESKELKCFLIKFKKNIYLCFIDYTKAFDCVDHSKMWKILREMKTRLLYLSPEKPICKSKSSS